MFSGVLAEADGLLEGLLGSLEPGCLSGGQAVGLLARAVAVKRRAAAVELALARRVAETGAWAGEGDRSAAHWLARTTGISVGQAIGMLETAHRLQALDDTADAFAAGALSEAQVREIASAAGADPAAEAALLDTAARQGLGELRDRARRVKRAAAGPDDLERHRAIHRDRMARRWVDDQGAGRIELRGPVEDVAAIWAGIEPARQQVFRHARQAGRRDPYPAYTFDAFVRTCTTGGEAAGGRGRGGPAAMVHAVIDVAALARGHTEAGETAELPGVGPVPVATIRGLLGDATVKAIFRDGVDVKAVVHLGHTVTAHQRSALEARDPTCQVPGCNVRDHLEIHHILGWALTRRTRLDELARVCTWHHHCITYLRYQLTGRPGDWQWIPPPTP